MCAKGGTLSVTQARHRASERARVRAFMWRSLRMPDKCMPCQAGSKPHAKMSSGHGYPMPRASWSNCTPGTYSRFSASFA